MEFLPDGGHAVARESGEIMSRRPRRNHTPAFKAKVALAAIKAIGHWRSLPSSSTFIPIRSRRGKRSLRKGIRCVWSRRQQCSRGAGDRREVAARQDRRTDAGKRVLSLTLANLNGAQERALSRLKDGPGNFFTVTASPKP